MNKASDLLLDIAAEKNGYSIGDPWRMNEFSLAAVVPISRIVPSDYKRGYLLLSEVTKGVTIKDTGNINEMEIINHSGYAVFVKAGEYVAGGTQTRALAVSQIIFSEESIKVPCACVHASKGIRANQQVKVDGYAPTEVRNELYKGYNFDEDDETIDLFRHHEFPFGNGRPNVGIYRNRDTYPRGRVIRYSYNHNIQNSVWGSVKSRSMADTGRVMSFAAHNDLSNSGRLNNYFTPLEDLAGRMNENEGKLKEVLEKIPIATNQTGLALLTFEGINSLENFEHPDSWNAFRKNLVKSEATKLVDQRDQNSLFEFKVEKAKEIIKNLLKADFKEKTVVDKENSQTTILETDKFQGEVVFLYNNPIHCSFMSKSK